MIIKPSRRFFLTAGAALLAAPALVRVESLMKIRGVVMLPDPLDVALPFPSAMKMFTLNDRNEVVPAKSMRDLIALMGERRVVGRYLGKGVSVSTIFLGVDLGGVFRLLGGGSFEPITFETMVFGGNGGWTGYQQRYESWDDAKAGHDRIVAAVKAGATGIAVDDS